MAHTPAAAGSGGHGHAVVIGSGIAGLTAARALAYVMDQVTVLERDRLPHGPRRRRGLPQARHTHSLTSTARHGLEHLFPGIGKNLTDAGAVLVRTPKDTLILGPGGWLPRFDSPLSLLSATRDLIDSVLRDRLHTDPKVTFLPEHEAVHLEPGRHDTVVGVWVRRRDRKTPDGWTPQHLIPADFVVDASGHNSPAPRWLTELGYKPPKETVTGTRTTYATAVFTPPIGHVADWKSLLLMDSPTNPRQGTLHPIERGRWSITLGFTNGEEPPATHNELLHAASTLRHPLLHDIIQTATPLTPVYRHHHTPNRWRHYEKLRRWPDQFLVVGDALTTLTPAHGQGMNLAVQCALTLDHILTSHHTTTGLTYRLRHALAHHLTPTWRATTHNTPTTRLTNRYTTRLATAATNNPHAATHLLKRLHTLATPTTTLHPRLLHAALHPPHHPTPTTPPTTTHHTQKPPPPTTQTKPEHRASGHS